MEQLKKSYPKTIILETENLDVLMPFQVTVDKDCGPLLVYVPSKLSSTIDCMEVYLPKLQKIDENNKEEYLRMVQNRDMLFPFEDPSLDDKTK